MFALRWTTEAAAVYETLKAKARDSAGARQQAGKRKSSKVEGLFKQVHKTIELLKNNPRHPGLQTHEYRSIVNPFDDAQKVFEAYAQHKTPGAYRVFWCYGPEGGELTIIAITPHP